ncbi:hypothetical protein LAZ67_20001839 [Cordylochernes scorpioides]|uniref:Uncharacterized protein n=1 Tax=Cordylochernes scorpioides TaxID=51811 RepID=A0ABY6LP83_9ARAC|nr:hypothetical protein LAZ67_20001839 [Cordylochernes scorpioides]
MTKKDGLPRRLAMKLASFPIRGEARPTGFCDLIALLLLRAEGTAEVAGTWICVVAPPMAMVVGTAGHTHHTMSIFQVTVPNSQKVRFKTGNFWTWSNYMLIAAPEGFNFGKPNEWPIWFKRFQRYRIASGLSEKSENEQVNALVYIMGDMAEEILILFNLSEAQNND